MTIRNCAAVWLLLTAASITAVILAGCSSGTTPVAHQSSTPAATPLTATTGNTALCGLVKTQLQIDSNNTVTAATASLDVISALLPHGPASSTLRTGVTAWALALSTDLSEGLTSSPQEQSALTPVKADCQSIGVTLP